MRTVDNPPNPFVSEAVEWLGPPPEAKLRIHEEQAKEILARNESPDLPFRYSLNPYRGCYHACAYCYARPTHQYLGFGAGSDFERELVVKVNAPERLRATFERRSWRGEAVMFSGNTDCYQPLEAAYQLTRRCLAVCAEYHNPVGIITKGALVQRDLDVLQTLARSARVRVFFSVPFAEDKLARLIEPGASPISKRLRAMAALASAGIDVGVAVAPVIPGLNDDQIPTILARAREAGARHAGIIALRLADEVAEVFHRRIAEALPGHHKRLTHAIEDAKGGRPDDKRFHQRMRGSGPRWQTIHDLFHLHAERLGFDTSPRELQATTFERPRRQLPLF